MQVLLNHKDVHWPEKQERDSRCSPLLWAIMLMRMDCRPPGSSVHVILQARIPEWVAISYSRGSSQPRDRAQVSCISCIGRQILYQLHHQGSPSLT